MDNYYIKILFLFKSNLLKTKKFNLSKSKVIIMEFGAGLAVTTTRYYGEKIFRNGLTK